MPLITILTQPHFFEGETAVINALFAEGMERLHVRKPETGRGEIVHFLQGILPEFYPKIVLHQHVDLAIELGFGGVHFPAYERQALRGEKGEGKKKIFQIKGLTISTAMHGEDMGKGDLKGYDYLLVSPVFDSISKAGYRQNSMLDPRKIREETDAQLIALGGIHQGNIRQAFSMGFDGVAVLGAIWQNPEKALEIWREMNAEIA